MLKSIILVVIVIIGITAGQQSANGPPPPPPPPGQPGQTGPTASLLPALLDPSTIHHLRPAQQNGDDENEQHEQRWRHHPYHPRWHHQRHESSGSKNMINLNLGLSNNLGMILDGRKAEHRGRFGGDMRRRRGGFRGGFRGGRGQRRHHGGKSHHEKSSSEEHEHKHRHHEGKQEEKKPWWCKAVESLNQDDLLEQLNDSISYIVQHFSAASQNITGTNNSHTSYLWDLMPVYKKKFILKVLNLSADNLDWDSLSDSAQATLLSLNEMHQKEADDALLKRVFEILSPIKFDWVVNITRVKHFLKEQVDADFTEILSALLDEYHQPRENSSADLVKFLKLVSELRTLVKCRSMEKKCKVLHPFVHHWEKNEHESKHNHHHEDSSSEEKHKKHHGHGGKHSESSESNSSESSSSEEKHKKHHGHRGKHSDSSSGSNSQSSESNSSSGSNSQSSESNSHSNEHKRRGGERQRRW